MNARPQHDQEAKVKVPAHLQAFVDVLGLDGAVEFLLAFGGGNSYLSLKPDPMSPVAGVMGVEATARLAERLGAGTIRVPTGKPFIASVLRSKGLGTSEIARKLHVSDVTVRRYSSGDTRQLSLFGRD